MNAISAVLKKQIIIKRENISAVVALRIHSIGFCMTVRLFISYVTSSAHLQLFTQV